MRGRSFGALIALLTGTAACDMQSATCRCAVPPTAFITVSPRSQLFPAEVLSGDSGIVSVMEPRPMMEPSAELTIDGSNVGHEVSIGLVKAVYDRTHNLTGDYEVGGTRENFNGNQITLTVDGTDQASASGQVHLEQSGTMVTGSFEVRLLPLDRLGAAPDPGRADGGHLFIGELSAQIIEVCSPRDPRKPTSFCADFERARP